MHLKNDLYRLAELEKEAAVDLFYSFGYPNIKMEDVEGFIEALYYLEDSRASSKKNNSSFF